MLGIPRKRSFYGKPQSLPLSTACRTPTGPLNCLLTPRHRTRHNHSAPPFLRPWMTLQTQTAPLFTSSTPSAFFPQDLTWGGGGAKTDLVLPKGQPPPS